MRRAPRRAPVARRGRDRRHADHRADTRAVLTESPQSTFTVGQPRPVSRHLRPRGDGTTQPITTVELFFDLVYVFAVTQLSHQILGDLTVGGVTRAAFLLLIVWWAWIYTTWMANWFDPRSPGVQAVLTGVMLASLLMAAALPEAFGDHGVLFAAELRRSAGRAQRRGRITARARSSAARRLRAAGRVERRVGRAVAARIRVGWRRAAAAVDPRGGARLRGAGRGLLAARSRPRGDHGLRHRGRPLRRALPGLHHHRPGRVDRRHRRNGGRRRADLHRRRLPHRRLPGDRSLVVAVLRRDGGALARRDAHVRRPGAPRSRRLHLPAPTDHRRDHRRGRRRRPADRRPPAPAARRRTGDGARWSRVVPPRRKPVSLAHDQDREHQATRCRSGARAAGAGRRPRERADAQRDRGRAADRRRAVGAASAPRDGARAHRRSAISDPRAGECSGRAGRAPARG